ncbi:MAG: TMEM43 family protein [candidate division WOR-3 bacterium]
MPDEYVEVKRTGWGQNIIKSISGIIIGFLMFIISFVVLWTNEGRTNLGKVAETALIVSPDAINSSADGKLVSITGTLETTTPIGDPEFLKPGKYVRLERIVEMFAWVEEKETKTEKKVGGTTEEKTVYRYKKEWTRNPKSSGEFKYPEGHENPYKSVSEQTFYAPSAKIGIYSFDPQSATLPSARPVYLTTQNVIFSRNGKLVGTDYIFIGKGTFDNPQVGDIRLRFEAVQTGISVTLFGKKQGENIIAYLHKGRDRLFRALSGTREEAIATLKTEHKMIGWFLRIVGFLLMWIGLNLILGPIGAILDILPFLGNLSRGIIGVITFLVALVLSIVTILISMIFHNLVALIIFIIVVVALIFLLRRRKRPVPSTTA